MSKDEISVPRELLERILHGCMFTLGSEQYGEIKALLAQPNTCTKDGGQCGLGGYREPCHSVDPVAELLRLLRLAWGAEHVSAEDCRRIDAILASPVEAAREVVEKAVYRCHQCGLQTPPPAPYKFYVSCECGSTTSATAALYRHPPAQAPVVLPQFNSWYATNIGVLGTQAYKHDLAVWNACLDELKRLNPGIEQ